MESFPPSTRAVATVCDSPSSRRLEDLVEELDVYATHHPVPRDASGEESPRPLDSPQPGNSGRSCVPSGTPLGEPSGYATPGVEMVNAGAVSPAGGPGQPAGFSPSQISQAYGFNRITFNNGTVRGDGSGQTIAIVDAYNQPNIISNLHTFDS